MILVGGDGFVTMVGCGGGFVTVVGYGGWAVVGVAVSWVGVAVVGFFNVILIYRIEG